MEYAISVLLSGISVGGQYALIAIGLHHGVWDPAPHQLCPWRCVYGGRPDWDLSYGELCPCMWGMPLDADA